MSWLPVYRMPILDSEGRFKLLLAVIIIGGLLLISVKNGMNSPCPFCGWAPAGTPWTKDRFDPKAIIRRPNP